MGWKMHMTGLSAILAFSISCRTTEDQEALVVSPGDAKNPIVVARRYRPQSTTPQTAGDKALPKSKPRPGYHWVQGYHRSNGTWVEGHWRTNRDNSFGNNWSAEGNTNPFTDKVGKAKPPAQTWVDRHTRNGTEVKGHYRTTSLERGESDQKQ